MTTPKIDSITRIHGRYPLTLINPSSFYHSLIISVIVVSLLVLIINLHYFENNNLVLRLVVSIFALLITQYIDSRFIKNKEYSKSIHMSLFGNAIWLITVVIGLLSIFIFSKSEVTIFYVVEGMFLFASFRIGIFTTTLGVSIVKSWMICFIQPLSMFFALIPTDVLGDMMPNQFTIAYGIIFLTIATAWSMLTDRAGRPYIQSTHRLIQAYLSSISKNDPTEVESIIEKQSKISIVNTSQIRLYNNDRDFRLVLPDIHPGPYNPIGGSNITYLIYKNMKSSAMVMHSVSNHSLNIPSKYEVNKYLKSLTVYTILHQGKKCTEPAVTQINRARATGLIFENTAILFLSLSPYGSEDFPDFIKNELEIFSKNYKLQRILVIDCHNAMGKKISKNDERDLLKAAKSSLIMLMNMKKFDFKFGYYNSNNMNLNAPDLGCGGISILCLLINKKKYFLGWADSNNMENGVREKIVNTFLKNKYKLLEICTSDTHHTTKGARNKNGYYQFGIVSDPHKIASWYLKIAKNVETKIKSASFEVLENKAHVKVMGSKIYEKYSKAVDKSMNITKIFLIVSVFFFVLSII